MKNINIRIQWDCPKLQTSFSGLHPGSPFSVSFNELFIKVDGHLGAFNAVDLQTGELRSFALETLVDLVALEIAVKRRSS